MSLLTLLVDFPNYSARKVRRLAKQIAMVQGLQKMADVGEETGILKGIESDLMEYNLQEAKRETQLNDDVPAPVPSQEAILERGRQIHEIMAEQMITDNICVTPVEAARKAINEMASWMHINMDANLKRDEVEKLMQKCHGIINGQSFYTDRSFIQAKLSPQGDLPLNHAQSGEPA